MNGIRSRGGWRGVARRLPALILLLVPAVAGAALKDDAFEERRDAFRAAMKEQARDDAGPPDAALKAIGGFAGTVDSRVLKELVKGFSPAAREVERTRQALDKATEALDKVRKPYFEQVEAYYREHGAFPETILVVTKDALETLGKAQAAAAARWDAWLRIQDALRKGLAVHLNLLRDDRKEVWRDVVKAASDPKDPEQRAAFAHAFADVPGDEVEKQLLAMEKDEKEPSVVIAVLDSLSRRRSAAAFDRFLARLASDDWGIASTAIQALARFRRPEVLPALIGRLQSAEGRVMADLLDALFNMTGKHLPDTWAAWNGWWTKEGEAFLVRWSPDKEVRRKAIDDISMLDPQAFDVPAELAALLPTEPDAEVREELVENLSIHRSNFARSVLLDVLRDPDRDLRLAAIRGLAQYRHIAVPEALIRLVDGADDEELYAIFNSLRTLWGGAREFSVEKPDRDQLHRWWDNNKDRVARHFIRLGAQDVAAGKRAPAGDEARWEDRNFYGIQVLSRNALFVVDFSFSMEDPAIKGNDRKKVEVAKAELTRAITSLPEGGSFGVILFANEPEAWGNGMMPATAANKRQAIEWLTALTTRSATNIFDTLQLCFQLGTPDSPLKSFGAPDTIYFVSDGAATVGRFTDSEKILEYVRRWNLDRRIKIHAIGVGEDQDIDFLRKLAEENGGYYVAR